MKAWLSSLNKDLAGGFNSVDMCLPMSIGICEHFYQ